MRKLVPFVFILFCFFQSEAQPLKLKVASYNLRLNTKADGINAWDNRKEVVNELIRYHDFDIIGTQEGFKAQLDDIISLGGYAYTGSGRDDGKDAGEHSAILYKPSKYQLLSSGDFWYSETPDKPSKGWDARCCNRICSWAKFKDITNSKTFFVFNSHFDHEGVEARKNSAILLLERIKSIAESEPVIVMGDFNSTPETEQMQRIDKVLNDAFAASKTKPYGPIGTFNAFKYDAPLKDRIDYVFVSSDFEVLKYAALTDTYVQRFPSDHLPVVAELVLSETK